LLKSSLDHKAHDPKSELIKFVQADPSQQHKQDIEITKANVKARTGRDMKPATIKSKLEYAQTLQAFGFDPKEVE